MKLVQAGTLIVLMCSPCFAADDSPGRTGTQGTNRVPLNPASSDCRGRECRAYTVRNDVMKPSSFRYEGRAVLPQSKDALYVTTLLCNPELLKKDIRRFDLACIVPTSQTRTQVLPRPDAQVVFTNEIYQAARRRVTQRLAGCFSILWTAPEHGLNRESVPVELRFSTYTLNDADACE